MDLWLFMEVCLSAPAVQTLFTPEEYFVLERETTRESEYLNGEIFAMSGASLAYTFITADIVPELNIQLNCKRLCPAV